MTKKTGLFVPAAVLLILLASCGSQGEKNPGRKGPEEKGTLSAEENPAVTLLRKLEDFLRFEDVLPQMALSEEQKGSLMPLLEEWKNWESEGKEYDQELIINEITALLTEGQKSYDPVPEENSFPGQDSRPGPPDSGSPGERPSGPPPGGNPPGGNPPGEKGKDGRNEDGRSSLVFQIDKLLRLLGGEEALPPPPPESDS